MKKYFIGAVLVVALLGCQEPSNQASNLAKSIGDTLGVQYEVLHNAGTPDGIDCAALGADWGECNRFKLTLSTGDTALPADGWALYVHSIRRLLSLEHEDLEVKRVTGDLHVITPKASFQGLASNQTLEVKIIGEYWQVSETDFMPRAFIQVGEQTAVIESTNTEDMSAFVLPISKGVKKRSLADEAIPVTAAIRYEKYKETQWQAVDDRIIPKPQSITLGKGTADLSKGINLQAGMLSPESEASLKSRVEALGLIWGKGYSVNFSKSDVDEENSEAYQLKVTAEGATIAASDARGWFYGVHSLLAWLSLDTKQVPTGLIKDAPRFGYRAVMIDVARNFHTPATLKLVMDQMAAYKLNTLHLHLSDDEGWRVAIDGLPELTEIGARRCFDLSETKCVLPQLGSGPDDQATGSGFFSASEFVDLLKYAKARHITVIPEFDMPAHARAAVVSMEARYHRLMSEGKKEQAEAYRLADPDDTSDVITVQFYDRKSFMNPCQPSTLAFIEKVMDEVLAMYQQAGMPLTAWHFGGDEAKNIRRGAGYPDHATQDMPFQGSAKCKALVESGVVKDYPGLTGYLAKEVAKLAHAKKIPAFQSWEDGLKSIASSDELATPSARTNFWETNFWGGAPNAYAWSAKGFEMIMSQPDFVYFDFPYEIDSQERGYYWASRGTDTLKTFSYSPENLPQTAEIALGINGTPYAAKGEVNAPRFIGMSAQLWTETTRTGEQVQYMLFPRLLAFAERSWHKAEWELPYQVGKEYSGETTYVDKAALAQDWQGFANVVGQRELAKLEAAGIQYRIAPVGAKYLEGVLQLAYPFPGTSLEYSLDAGQKWQMYTSSDTPQIEGATIKVRALSPSGNRVGRATGVQP